MIGAARVLEPVPRGDVGEQRLLAGPAVHAGAEPYWHHVERLGQRPTGGAWVVEILRHAELRGRGGAWFPTHRKVERVIARREYAPTLIINASEGEPLSRKDQTLITRRPHLVLDGAVTLAETIGAAEIVVYISRSARAAERALRTAFKERHRGGAHDVRMRIVKTAHRYVSGESSAVAHRVAGGPAKPQTDRPTSVLVNNAETVAHIGLLTRHGAGWFRSTGVAGAPGTLLLTLCGAVANPGVVEVPSGVTIGAAVELAGGCNLPAAAFLIGGYAGTWLDAQVALERTLQPDDVAPGCGIVAALPQLSCGVRATAEIARYMAGESAQQCGPCIFGLDAIASALEKIARGDADASDAQRLSRWCAQVGTRGGCGHPGGAVRTIVSAMDVFGDDIQCHLQGHPCAVHRHPLFPAPPPPQRGWR